MYYCQGDFGFFYMEIDHDGLPISLPFWNRHLEAPGQKLETRKGGQDKYIESVLHRGERGQVRYPIQSTSTPRPPNCTKPPKPAFRQIQDLAASKTDNPLHLPNPINRWNWGRTDLFLTSGYPPKPRFRAFCRAECVYDSHWTELCGSAT